MNDAEEKALDVLFDALARALAIAVDISCPSTRALWLRATARERAKARPLSSSAPVLNLPPGFAQWQKSKRSKYEALATFRHAVVWQLDAAARTVETAMGRTYFTPCMDAEPFSHSDAPGARTPTGRAERSAAQQECATAIGDLRERRGEIESALTTRADDLAARLLAKSTRPTLRDVLKLEKIADPFDEGGQR